MNYVNKDDYRKGYKQALLDVNDILTHSLLKDFIRTKKQVVTLLNLFTKKADLAVNCPDIKYFKTDDKNNIVEITLLIEGCTNGTQTTN